MTKIRIRLGRWAAALAVTALAAGSAFWAAGPASAASTTSYNPIKNASPGNLCLDVMSEDGLHNENARLQIYHCTGVSEQKYILVQAVAGRTPVPGWFEIRPQSDPSMCLFSSNLSAFDGQPVQNGLNAQVVQRTCLSWDPTEIWTFKSTNEITDGRYGMCLDTTSSGTHDHEHVMISPCNGNLSQRWLS